jgi:hypothetical protein
LDIAAAVMKWYGVVPDASKKSPSIDPMHPSVQNGRSMRPMVVPYAFVAELFSHSARPQPWDGSAPSPAIVCTTSWYSPYAAFPS